MSSARLLTFVDAAPTARRVTTVATHHVGQLMRTAMHAIWSVDAFPFIGMGMAGQSRSGQRRPMRHRRSGALSCKVPFTELRTAARLPASAAQVAKGMAATAD